MNWQELHDQLTEPFDPKDIQWRAGSVSRDKKRAQALAYADPRIYEDRLDEVLGSDWEVTFEPWGEQRLVCTLTIRLRGETGERVTIRRSSTGEFDSSDRVSQGTTAEAQALKRACSKFGLGRYLYDLPATWVGHDENSRRLTETPPLPKSAQPKVQQPPSPVAEEATNSLPETKVREPNISEANANVLAQKLVEFGYPTQDHTKLAERLIERTVKALTDLNRDEAGAVFSYVQRNPVQVKAA